MITDDISVHFQIFSIFACKTYQYINMKRTLIFITLLVLLLCGGVARGQEDTNACAKPKACYHTMSVYVSMGPGDILLSLVQFGYDGKLRFGHYDVGFLYNFHFNSHWSLGVGTEFHSSNGLWTIGGFPSLFFNNNFNLYHKDLYTLPVYANFRYAIGNRAVKPILELKAGYAFSIRSVFAYSVAHNSTNPGCPEIEWQGTMKAGGFYAGMAVGVSIRRCHRVVFGFSHIPVEVYLVNYSEGKTMYEKDLMWNIYMRYGFTFFNSQYKRTR